MIFGKTKDIKSEYTAQLFPVSKLKSVMTDDWLRKMLEIFSEMVDKCYANMQKLEQHNAKI